MKKITTEQFYKTSNDVNGNPRYVLHYLSLSDSYTDAMIIGKKAFGKKFNNKQFGVGIVFQTYRLTDVCDRLNALLNLTRSN